MITFGSEPDAVSGHASAWHDEWGKLLGKNGKQHHCSQHVGFQCDWPCPALPSLYTRTGDTATHHQDFLTSAAGFWGPSLGRSVTEIILACEIWICGSSKHSLWDIVCDIKDKRIQMSWHAWPLRGSEHEKSSLNCIHIQCTANSHHHSWTWSCSPRCSDPL